jgi:serine/threonine-protein kinase
MDYLQGVALSDLIKDEGQLGVERSIKVLSQATDALDHAHRMGVIHRDLKPSNIMLIDYEDEKDYVKVVDFGVAKIITAGGEQQRLTQMGEVCGSPVYMSPEQCQGLELDNRSDIYSMGIVIYETLTGRLPILGKTMVDTMSKHITDMPPHFNEVRPDLYIPERLEAVVFKALAKDPADRHQSMAELTRDLETAIPRPGKSAVLRSDAPQQGAAVEAKKALPVKVLVIAAVTLLVGGLGLKFVLDASQPKVKPVQAVVPVSPAVAPGAVKPNTAPNGANPNAASPGSTAVVNPGAASSSSSSSSSGSATATSAAPGSHASNASNASNATSANSAASGTGATSAAVVQSQSPKEPVKEVVKLTHEVKEVREKPRVAAQPRVKKVRKVAVKAESADDVVPTGAGSAAAYARRSAAGGDPWKDLKSSRRY